MEGLARSRFQVLIVKMLAKSWADSCSSKCRTARAYTSSGTPPWDTRVTASARASSACSFSVKKRANRLLCLLMAMPEEHWGSWRP
jgi:hypothetical protein